MATAKLFDLTGKVALITGGNSGIGLGMADGLAASGAAVCVWGTNEDKNTAAAEQLRKHGDAAGALATRLQEDLRASEEAVRKVHHHLIDASRFILSKVEYRR